MKLRNCKQNLMPIRKTNTLLKVLSSFSSFFYSIWLGVLFFKESLCQAASYIRGVLGFLVRNPSNLASGPRQKYSGFLAWCSYIKKALIANPVWLVPISIAGWYVWYYIAWAWQVGWWLAFIIVRARFLACLNHTVRLI